MIPVVPSPLPMIPVLDAQWLPDDVRRELELYNWDDGGSVCLHGDGGSVTRLWPAADGEEPFPALPQTRAWLISIGVVPDERGRLCFAMEGT